LFLVPRPTPLLRLSVTLVMGGLIRAPWRIILGRTASEYRSYRAWRNQELRRRLRGDLRKEEEKRVEAGKDSGEGKKEIKGKEEVICRPAPAATTAFTRSAFPPVF